MSVVLSRPPPHTVTSRPKIQAPPPPPTVKPRHEDLHAPRRERISPQPEAPAIDTRARRYAPRTTIARPTAAFSQRSRLAFGKPYAHYASEAAPVRVMPLSTANGADRSTTATAALVTPATIAEVAAPPPSPSVAIVAPTKTSPPATVTAVAAAPKIISVAQTPTTQQQQPQQLPPVVMNSRTTLASPPVTKATTTPAQPIVVDMAFVRTEVIRGVESVLSAKDEILHAALKKWIRQAPPSYRTTRSLYQSEFTAFAKETVELLKKQSPSSPTQWSELETKSEREIAYCPLRWMIHCSTADGTVALHQYRELLKCLGMPENTPNDEILAVINTRLPHQTESVHIQDMKEEDAQALALKTRGERVAAEHILTRLFMQTVEGTTQSQDILQLAELMKVDMCVVDLIKRMNEVAVVEEQKQNNVDEKRARLLTNMKREIVDLYATNEVIRDFAPDFHGKVVRWQEELANSATITETAY